MDKLPSLFTEGTIVAFFPAYSQGEFRKSRVARVYKNERFLILGHGSTQFTPDHGGDIARNRGYNPARVEVWTARHDDRIAEARDIRVREGRVRALASRLTLSDLRRLPNEVLDALQAILDAHDGVVSG